MTAGSLLPSLDLCQEKERCASIIASPARKLGHVKRRSGDDGDGLTGRGTDPAAETEAQTGGGR